MLADRGVRKTLAVDGRGADQDLLRTEELLQRLPVADAVLQRQDDRLRPDAAADAFDGVACLERLDEHDQKVKDLRNLRRTDGAERPARDRPLVGLDGQAGLLDGLCLLLPVRQKRDVRPAGEIAAEQTAHRAGPNDPDFRSHMHALREVGYTGVIAVECRPYPDAYTGAERCIRYMRAMETIVDIERSNFR